VNKTKVDSSLNTSIPDGVTVYDRNGVRFTHIGASEDSEETPWLLFGLHNSADEEVGVYLENVQVRLKNGTLYSNIETNHGSVEVAQGTEGALAMKLFGATFNVEDIASISADYVIYTNSTDISRASLQISYMPPA